MTEYRSKPKIIEATQWFKHGDHPGVERYAVKSTVLSEEPFTLGEPREWEYYVTTIHGQAARVVPGDWIITEPDGVSYYPCKPDIFAKSYEPVSP